MAGRSVSAVSPIVSITEVASAVATRNSARSGLRAVRDQPVEPARGNRRRLASVPSMLAISRFVAESVSSASLSRAVASLPVCA